MAIVAVLVLVGTGAMLFIRHRGHGDARPKPVDKHRGAASIVKKSAAVPGIPRSEKDHGALRLEGQVIDQDQRPVASAQVVLVGTDSTTLSGEDGTFAFENLASRRYRLKAIKDEMYAPNVTVRLTDTSEPVVLRMHRGATLVTHVNTESGPVVGAAVTMDGTVKAVSGADGIARIGGLGPDFHGVEVTADGYAATSFSMMIGDDPGGTIERTVVLKRGAMLSGSVVGPDGKAVASASVDIQALSSSTDRWSGRATTDANGNWKFDVLSAGKYSLQASSEVYGPGDAVVVDLDGASPKSGVNLNVAYDAQLVGTVVDVDGKPVADCRTYANASIENSYSERTDANGHFELLGIVAAEYDVFCVKGSLSSRSVHVSIANNERVEVRLVVDEGGIAGIVVDTKGDPVAEARVSAMPTGQLSMASFGEDTTDSHGRFDLGGLPPGEYLVSATWPDQQERRLGNGDRILTGNRNVKLVLETPATLTGRALLDGKPLTYYGLLVTESPQYPFIGNPNGVRSPDGRFTVRGVTPGTWGLVLIGPGTARKTLSDLHVETGKVTDVGDITMEHGQRVSGRVLDSNGKPVAGAHVQVGRASQLDETEMQQSFKGEFETTSDASGAYRFEGVAPLGGRPSNIAASHPVLGASTPVPLPAGDAVVDLKLAATGAIDGVVEGQSPGIALVSAERVDDPSARMTARVDATGQFHFDALAPGDYSVSLVAMPGQVGASTKVTVIAKQRVAARITLGGKRITLIIKVVGTECKGVMLKPAAEGAGSATSSDMGFQQCSQGKAQFQVPPGSYSACPDGAACQPVEVAAAPSTQTIEIHATH